MPYTTQIIMHGQTNTHTNTTRWPPPPKACVWDCGNYWDGYETPTHIGLKDDVRDMFVKRLDFWKQQCVAHAKEKLYCLKRSDAMSIKNAIRAAKQKEYLQEVCGEYVDEYTKVFLDSKGWLNGAIGAIVYAAMQGKYHASASANSLFLDDTAKHVTDREYR